MTYNEMSNVMAMLAETAGFPIGAPVVWKKRTGVVARFNPFFYDLSDPPVYVDLEPKKVGQSRPDRRLINLSELTKEHP